MDDQQRAADERACERLVMECSHLIDHGAVEEGDGLTWGAWPRLPMGAQIGLRKAITFEEKRKPVQRGDGVREAVTDVQPGRVPTLPEPSPRRRSRCNMHLVDHCDLVDDGVGQQLQVPGRIGSLARLDDDLGFDRRHGRQARDVVLERVEILLGIDLAQNHGDECRPCPRCWS